MDGREELNCPDDLVVTRYIDGDLAAGDHAGVEAHLGRCPACAKRIRVLRSLMECVGPPVDEPLPNSLHSKLMSIPDRAPARHGGKLYVLAAAAAAILLLTLRGPEALEEEPGPAVPPSLRSRVEIALVTPTVESALWLGGLGDAARVPLQRIALDDDPAPARAAIRSLMMLGRREAVPIFLRALDLPDRREEALTALAAFGEQRAVPRIAALLGDKPWRESAIRALAAIGGAGAARALAGAVGRSGDEGADRALVAALGAVDGRQGTAALLALLDRPLLREAVLAAFAANAGACTPHLAEMAAGRNAGTAGLALEVLAQVATPAAVPAARRLLSDYDRRIAAVRVLVRVDTPEAGAALLSRPLDPEMRAELMKAGPNLIAQFSDSADRGRAAVRARAVDLLAEIGTDEAVRALVAIAERNRNMEGRVRRALLDQGLKAGFAAVAAEPPRTGRRASGIN